MAVMEWELVGRRCAEARKPVKGTGLEPGSQDVLSRALTGSVVVKRGGCDAILTSWRGSQST